MSAYASIFVEDSLREFSRDALLSEYYHLNVQTLRVMGYADDPQLYVIAVAVTWKDAARMVVGEHLDPRRTS